MSSYGHQEVIDKSLTNALTLRRSNDFYEIMDMLDKRLNDRGKNWRHVLKALKVLDYCLHEGSELVVTWARKNIYIIKTLREFQHIDDDGRDVGLNGMTTECPCKPCSSLTESSESIGQGTYLARLG